MSCSPRVRASGTKLTPLSVSVGSGSFTYCDPPYIGRHVDYYDSWDEEQETVLHDALESSGAKFMVSTWDHNRYRKNEYIGTVWKECRKIMQEHFYHVGAKKQEFYD